jgi:hypothetical protein
MELSQNRSLPTQVATYNQEMTDQLIQEGFSGEIYDVYYLIKVML